LAEIQPELTIKSLCIAAVWCDQCAAVLGQGTETALFSLDVHWQFVECLESNLLLKEHTACTRLAFVVCDGM